MKSYLLLCILVSAFSHAMHNSVQDIALAQALSNQKRSSSSSTSSRSLEHPQPRAAQDVTPLLTPFQDKESPPLIMPTPSPINGSDNPNEITFFTPSSGEVTLAMSDDESDRVIVKRKKESLCNKHNVGTCVVVSCCCCVATLFAAFMFCYPLVNV